jgi:hypothetical protein
MARRKINHFKPAEHALDAINSLGLALADHGHRWTKRERWLYARAVGWITSFLTIRKANDSVVRG